MLTVANTLSIGFEVRKWSHDRREVEECQQCLTIFDQAFDGLVVFGRVFFGEDRHRRFAAPGSETARSAQILVRVGLHRLRELVETFSVSCSQHR